MKTTYSPHSLHLLRTTPPTYVQTISPTTQTQVEVILNNVQINLEPSSRRKGKHTINRIKVLAESTSHQIEPSIGKKAQPIKRKLPLERSYSPSNGTFHWKECTVHQEAHLFNRMHSQLKNTSHSIDCTVHQRSLPIQKGCTVHRRTLPWKMNE